MYSNLYCKVYINSELEIEDLYHYINCKVAGRLEHIRSIKTAWGEMDLCRNRDFNPQIFENDPEDFVYWKYYLEIEPAKGIGEAVYIDQIARLLKGLISENIKVVASCDFEEDL